MLVLRTLLGTSHTGRFRDEGRPDRGTSDGGVFSVGTPTTLPLVLEQASPTQSPLEVVTPSKKDW